jgi:branched-chain amino acid transport system ATP-binding protein
LTLNTSAPDERTGNRNPAAPAPGRAAAPAERTLPRPSAQAAAPLLAVVSIVIRFGGIVALDGVSFELPAGNILGLIGPNGAGKTSLFNCVTGLYVPQEGEIRFAGRDILGVAAHRIAGLGITRTFQNLALFGTMTVRDNLRTGAHVRVAGNFVSDTLRIGTQRRAAAIDAVVDELIATFELGDVAERPVSDLSTGTQKRVELARALAGGPKLLLLDEPASGLNHTEVEQLGVMIRRIRDERGVTVLLVEHHMNLVMSVSDKVVALDFGRKIADGPPAAVRADAAVIRAYLGGAGR